MVVVGELWFCEVMKVKKGGGGVGIGVEFILGVLGLSVEFKLEL